MKHHRSSILLALSLLSALVLTHCSNSPSVAPTDSSIRTLPQATATHTFASPTALPTATESVDTPRPQSPIVPAADSPLPAYAKPDPSQKPSVLSPITSSPIEAPTPFAQSPIPASPLDPLKPEIPTGYTYAIINVYDHDQAAYTQGLVFEDGWLYESTGLRGQSSLRKVDLATGSVAKFLNLPAQFFGEGMTILDDKIYQLTWHAQTGFIFDKNDFSLLDEFHYATEGWGLTHDGERLIMSDGTATLHFFDPQTMEEVAQIQVTDRGAPVTQLNELEFIDGQIFANVWMTDQIAIIDPETGHVTGWIDLTGLLHPEERVNGQAVLNGIAHDAENGRLFLTGKQWPKLFEVEISEEE